MPAASTDSLERFIGRELDRLSLEDRISLAGNWIALEIYSPKTLPLRRIAAAGATIEDCLRQLRSRALDPARFELLLQQAPL